MYTNLGVITKVSGSDKVLENLNKHVFPLQGTVLEVNISELGLVTSGGKVVWGKYAQVSQK